MSGKPGKTKLCKDCGQPMLPKGVKKLPNEYDHAQGCPAINTAVAKKRKEFFKQNPNLRVAGWDERDYKLWSDIQVLPSYGLLANGDYMVSRNAVIALLKDKAEQRFAGEIANA